MLRILTNNSEATVEAGRPSTGCQEGIPEAVEQD
jgi:hypothetical protein